ncbi:MAG: PAS domain S-box protein [Acidobacteria bacterium]|nr:PAS domain S-box protein [Acidobacteriota bacterium]
MGSENLAAQSRQTPDIRLLTAAFEAAYDVIVITGRDGNILWVNPSFTRVTGYSAEEAVGQNTRLLKSGVHEPAYYSSLWETILKGDVWHGELVNRRKDGTLYNEEKTITPVRNENGEIANFIAVGQDITERKRSEEALRESEARFRSYFESPQVGIAIVTPNKEYLEVNDRFCEMVGYSREELMQTTWADITPGDDLALQLPIYERVLAGERNDYTIEKRYIRRDRTFIDVAVSSCAVRREDGAPAYFVVLVQDITERKRLEAEFLQSQKLESVARMAGGLGHDFNNLLTVISGYSELLLRQADPESEMRPAIEEVLEAAGKASALTRRLLAFGRKQLMQPKLLDLNQVVEDIRPMLKGMLGEDVQLVTLLGSDLGLVKADPGQIQQLIINLAANARDAMPFGGKLLIETVDAEIEPRGTGRHPGVAPGHYVVLTVSDTGHGMDHPTLHHLFEPFFTTKDPGGAAGLGLSVVHGIVEQSGGRISVASNPGLGTSFRIYLPRVAGVIVSETPAPISEARGGETLLIAEDHAPVRHLAALMLRDRGYQVIETADGQEAMMVLEDPERTVDLLLLDAVMPGMSSVDLIEQARAARPNIKVLVMSGYAGDAAISQRIASLGTPYLEKPFDASTLAAKVRQALR